MQRRRDNVPKNVSVWATGARECHWSPTHVLLWCLQSAGLEEIAPKKNKELPELRHGDNKAVGEEFLFGRVSAGGVARRES